MNAVSPGLDVLTMGRTGVDLYPLQQGIGLEEVTSFGKFLGGSPTNVAVAAARHGRSSAVITRTGSDPLGVFIRQELERLNVSAEYATAIEGMKTPIVLCEIFPPDNFPLYFYHARMHSKSVQWVYRQEKEGKIQIEEIDGVKFVKLKIEYNG